jgi:DNA-binding GntR family transcriptional regulator
MREQSSFQSVHVPARTVHYEEGEVKVAAPVRPKNALVVLSVARMENAHADDLDDETKRVFAKPARDLVACELTVNDEGPARHVLASQERKNLARRNPCALQTSGVCRWANEDHPRVGLPKRATRWSIQVVRMPVRRDDDRRQRLSWIENRRDDSPDSQLRFDVVGEIWIHEAEFPAGGTDRVSGLTEPGHTDPDPCCLSVLKLSRKLQSITIADSPTTAQSGHPLPIAAMTKSEAAYRAIRERIFDGRLQPGAVLNQEALAASLGLSTTPLREALRRLESEGLVELKAHRDMLIAPLTLRELHELYALRLQLDPYAGALAAEKASTETLSEVVGLADAPVSGTAADRLAANRVFHRAIYAASGNLLLVQLLDSLWDRTDRYRLLLVQEEAHVFAVAREHQAIARALMRRNAERVRQLLSRHVAAAERLIVQIASDRLIAQDP